DAVAGVINIITRKNFEGAEANAYYGQNEKGDGTTQRYSYTMGAVSDKGSIMMSASYTKQDVIWDSARSLTENPYGPRHPGVGYSTYSPVGKYQLDPANGGDIYALNGPGLDATDPA